MFVDEIYHTCHWSYEKLDDKLRFFHEIYHLDENQFHDHGNHNIVEVDIVDDENYYVKIDNHPHVEDACPCEVYILTFIPPFTNFLPSFRHRHTYQTPSPQ